MNIPYLGVDLQPIDNHILVYDYIREANGRIILSVYHGGRDEYRIFYVDNWTGQPLELTQSRETAVGNGIYTFAYDGDDRKASSIGTLMTSYVNGPGLPKILKMYYRIKKIIFGGDKPMSHTVASLMAAAIDWYNGQAFESTNQPQGETV